MAPRHNLLVEPRDLGLRHRFPLAIGTIKLLEVAGNALVNLHQSLTHLRKSVFPVSNNGLPHFFLGNITSRSFVAFTLSAASLCSIAGLDALVTARPAPAG